MNPVILFAAGEVQTYDSLRELFPEDSYELIRIENAEGVRELLGRRPVEIIIGDADFGGTELLIEVADRWPRSWRILLVSKPDLNAAFDSLGDQGVDAMLTKPRSTEQMAREIDDALLAVEPLDDDDQEQVPPVITLDRDAALADVDDLLAELRSVLEKRPPAK